MKLFGIRTYSKQSGRTLLMSQRMENSIWASIWHEILCLHSSNLWKHLLNANADGVPAQCVCCGENHYLRAARASISTVHISWENCVFCQAEGALWTIFPLSKSWNYANALLLVIYQSHFHRLISWNSNSSAVMKAMPGEVQPGNLLDAQPKAKRFSKQQEKSLSL